MQCQKGLKFMIGANASNDWIVDSAEKKENVLFLGLLFAGWYGANTYFNM